MTRNNLSDICVLYYAGSGTPYSGANPTIASYKASVVNFYNAAGSPVRFENKNVFFYFKNAVAYYSAGVVDVNLIVVGLAPGVSCTGHPIRRKRSLSLKQTSF
jgi:hypothetical protein